MNGRSPALRATRQAVGIAVVLAAWFCALALKQDDGGWDDAYWGVVVATGALLVLLLVALRVVPSWRSWQRGWNAALRALREHRDPGPGLRERTDTLAQQYARTWWAVWLWPFLAGTQLLTMEWDDPARATVATVLFVGVAVTFALYYRGLTRAARRWLADPPGPPREPAAPAVSQQVWASGGRLALIVTGAVVAGVAIGLLLVLVTH